MVLQVRPALCADWDSGVPPVAAPSLDTACKSARPSRVAAGKGRPAAKAAVPLGGKARSASGG